MTQPTPPRRPHMDQGPSHAFTAVTRGTGDRPPTNDGHFGARNRPRSHGSHTGPRGPTTPPLRSHGAQRTGYAFTAATRGPGDRPRLHDSHMGPRGPPTPPRSHTRTRRPATPPGRPHGDQGTGHTPTAATQGPGDRSRLHDVHKRPRGKPRRTTAKRGPGDWPRPHDGHTCPWGLPTPERQIHGTLGTSHPPRQPPGPR